MSETTASTASPLAILESIKAAADTTAPPLRVPVRDGSRTVGHLEPMPVGPRLDDDLAAALTAARNREPLGFASRFEATPARTRRWLESIVRHDPRRILFLGRDLDGAPVGQVGLIILWDPPGTAEFDNLIRIAPALPGFMTMAFTAMVDWAATALGVHTILSYPLADNEKTMRFHRRAGFALAFHVTLHEVALDDGEFRWIVPGSGPGVPTGRTRDMHRGILPLAPTPEGES